MDVIFFRWRSSPAWRMKPKGRPPPRRCGTPYVSPTHLWTDWGGGTTVNPSILIRNNGETVIVPRWKTCIVCTSNLPCTFVLQEGTEPSPWWVCYDGNDVVINNCEEYWRSRCQRLPPPILLPEELSRSELWVRWDRGTEAPP